MMKFVCKIFLGSTFVASWYIPALMISVTAVYFAGNKLSNSTLLLCSLPIYLFCCLASNYRGLLPESSIFLKLIFVYPGTIYNSFPVGLFWVVLGKQIAQTSKNLRPLKRIAGLITSVILLVVEYYLICLLDCSVDNDCYIMLIPVCVFLLSNLIHLDISIKSQTAKFIRNSSTIIYCFHGTFATFLKTYVFTSNCELNNAVSLFLITVSISLLMSMIIIFASKRIKWLRWAY